MSGLTAWLDEHYIVTYVIIFVLITYVYTKVFKTRRLPILKELIVYIILAIGALFLLFFQGVGLPIVYCLTTAMILLFMVRIRYFVESRQKRRKQ